MAPKEKRVRDFIYLDEDRLYSLYSQVFEGVADRIVESYAGEMRSGELKTSALGGESREAKVAEVTKRTENKLLYDHMYNLFDQKIGSEIVEIDGGLQDDLDALIRKAFLVKVTGDALIEDYERIYRFAERFNDLGGMIAYAQIRSHLEMKLSELDSQLSGAASKGERRAIQAQMEKLKNPASLAKAVGLHQDETVLKNIRMMIEMFYPDGYDVVVSPASAQAEILFRGVLDRRWLRLDPKLLRALYGGKPAAGWTMVGQVTYLPAKSSQHTGKAKNSAPQEEGDAAGDAEPSMREPFRDLFKGARVFEGMFVGSQKWYEVTLAPLAIYREVAVGTGE